MLLVGNHSYCRKYTEIKVSYVEINADFLKVNYVVYI